MMMRVMMILYPFLTDRREIEEDYWDSIDEDDDPHEHIECRLIVKNKSEKHHLIHDCSYISEINKINAQSQS
jgi:hypothetical protein